MKKYILDYKWQVEERLKAEIQIDDLEELKEKITYFQHERLIHLLVTLFFALLGIIFLILGMLSYLFLIPFLFFIVFVVFYIVHYYFLENSVQYFYKLMDEMRSKYEVNSKKSFKKIV